MASNDGKRAHIYGVVLNDKSYVVKQDGTEWKFCKIGLTQVDIAKGIGNRMEVVEREVRKKLGTPKVSILFVEPIHKPTDLTPQQVERQVRAAFGYKVHKDKVKDFPVRTEWVITTQRFITELKHAIWDMAPPNRSTKVFEACKFNQEMNPLPDELKHFCLPGTGGTATKATQKLEVDFSNLQLDDK